MWVLRASGLPDEPEGKIFRLTDGHIKTIGRATRADFIVDAPLVSRVHCRLTADKSGQLVVEDLDSTNGTSVNGARVQRAVAKAGDQIGVGKVTLAVERHDK
ncbi:MAG: FHA domain-containing protein [Acidobacteriota bacterium]|nr:FHA domain-containing protein [Acidobacteriota bacterium]